MPSIISPTGRALQAELQNMPPDQVQAYLAQNVGKVPMAELLAMKMQLDRMRQAAPQQQAPQSTVAQDMQAQLQQARGIRALPVQNVGQPQNYASGGIVAFQEGGATSPFGRDMSRGFGLGDIMTTLFRQPYPYPAAIGDPERVKLVYEARRRFGPRGGLMGYFATQSDEERQAAQNIMSRIPSMTNEQLRALVATSGPTTRPKITGIGRQAELAAQAAADTVSQNEAARRVVPRGLPAALPTALPKPAAQAAETAVPMPEDRDYESFLREIEKAGQERGIGKAITEREAYLKGKKAETEKDLADRARISRAQAFFKMAEESAKPGGTLLKGATAGLSQYAEAKQAMADRRESIEDRAKEMEFTLAQAKEQQAIGNMNAARQLYQRYEDNRQELEAEKRGYQQETALQRMREEGAATRSREATNRVIAANALRQALEKGRVATAQQNLIANARENATQTEAYKQLASPLAYTKDPEEIKKINAQLKRFVDDYVKDLTSSIDISEAESIIDMDLGEEE